MIGVLGEVLLGRDDLREAFYKALSSFARTLGIAMSSAKFLEETPKEKVDRYKGDLKFFGKLRLAVRRRYSEEIDFGEYEAKIQKLIDTHVGSGEVHKVTALVNIFDKEAFAKEVKEQANPVSKADLIASRTRKSITEKMVEDPVFYRKFSDMLEDAIRAFREQRMTDVAYLSKVQEIAQSVTDRTDDELPAALRSYDVARAFYGIVQEVIKATDTALGGQSKELGTEAALGIDRIVKEHRIVDWPKNVDVLNRMKIDMEELLIDLMKKAGVTFSFDDVDQIMEQCLEVAKLRYNQ